MAVAFKVLLLAQAAFPFNADEAVVGLMARHVLDGKIPVFFYGQAYMGSLDALLVAGAFRLLGEFVAAFGVQAVVYGATVATAVLLAWRIFHRLWLAGAAGLLLAIPSVNTTLYTTVSLGGYGEARYCSATCSCWHRGWPGRIRSVGGRILPGLLAGLGLWAFGSVLVFVAPTAVLLAVSLRRLTSAQALRRALMGLAAGMLGLLPWLTWTAVNGPEAALRELAGSAIAGASPAGLVSALAYRGLNLALFGTTVIAGVRPPWSVEWLSPWLLPIAVGFWLAVAGYALAALRRRDAARREMDARRGCGGHLARLRLHTVRGGSVWKVLPAADCPPGGVCRRADQHRPRPLWRRLVRSLAGGSAAVPPQRRDPGRCDPISGIFHDAVRCRNPDRPQPGSQTV